MGSIFDSDDIEVTPEQVQKAMAEGGYQVIDVREQYEWDAGRMEGTRHIELERLAAQADSIDKEIAVIFHCRLGARSAMAARAFRGAGYEAYTMTGGLERWAGEGRPLIPDGGYVADH